MDSLTASQAEGDDRKRRGSLSPVYGKESERYAKFKSWTTWILSVVLTAIMISHVRDLGTFGYGMKASTTKPDLSPEEERPNHTLPSRLKRASCARGGVNSNSYNLPLHVGALFIIFFVSGSSCAFPILAIKFPRLRIPPGFLFAARHFGTGVLIATAFVHLLPTAFILLGDPCLSNFWTTDYPAMPGAIALAAVFFIMLIEMVFSPAQHGCAGAQPNLDEEKRSRAGQAGGGSVAQEAVRPPIARRPSSTSVRKLGPLVGRTSSISRTVARMSVQNEEMDSVETAQQGTKTDEEDEKAKDDLVEDPERNAQDIDFELSREQQEKKAFLQCVMLEVGILFHSVFIGMSLSVSIANEFVVLLIAITFHQTFEGLALGSRIAQLNWGDKTIQPWLMAFAYGCTTPIGQAIGLATHTLYSPDSEVGLLLVGVMNAISAGVLVFASLVELLSEDFLSDESWKILRGRRRVYACVLVFTGAFGMSLVGAWA